LVLLAPVFPQTSVTPRLPENRLYKRADRANPEIVNSQTAELYNDPGLSDSSG